MPKMEGRGEKRHTQGRRGRHYRRRYNLLRVV